MKSSFPILLLALCEPARAIALGGVIPRLKQEIPHARITLVTTRHSVELFQDERGIDETVAVDGAIFNLKALGALAELSRRQWGLLVDIGPSMVSRMIRSKTRLVVNPNDPAGPLRQMCQALALEHIDVVPRLAVSQERAEKAQALLDAGRMSPPFVAMAPGASWLGRRWPTERFAVLATRLMREDGPFANHNLLIVGAEADRDTAVALSMATPRAQIMEMTGKLDLLTACAVLKKAEAFIGNDEIWLRLAAAAGIPTFGLYGPSDEADAPPGPNMHAIRGPRSLAAIRATDPKLKLSVCHMLDLSIDTVLDAIDVVTPRPEADSAEDDATDVVPEPAASVGIVAWETEIDIAADDVVLSDDGPTPEPLLEQVLSDVVVPADAAQSEPVTEDLPKPSKTPKAKAVREPAHAEKL
ncbi:glycosyltransferase family 9 heptosyltransferase family protein [Asticcacaulis biprosthecium C19]|uniref:Glycosyltransferase family 9 heptosyltransferase family protein n=1 Tax=Asticcacaulis biprosthecium C19 TaxID=715226 RepID=F4QPP7_9CAUL|nr:glycosyltransferase family 9 protein [Asticcacaulis biprosthecium]EGF90184.1 glycosyltransferase family 9 heptosyltransferase family protein [Asticcacaulis biprosthecium C19]